MSASVAASVVGIAAGVNSLSGGAITNAFGGGGGSSGGGSVNQGTYDPYGQYRGQAASQLNTLMNNPSLAMSQPGYQQQLQQGQEQSQRGAAATGMLQSGAEASALQSQGQNTFASFYNSQLANLMQLSGASQNPAAAALAQQQGATAAQNRMLQGTGTLTSGLSTLGGLFSGSGSNLGGGLSNYYGSSAISNSDSLIGDTGAGTTTNSFGQAVNNEFSLGI
jgi:hypothetical protein